MNVPSTGVKYKSSDKHIAKVNGKGIVTFKGGAGDVTITAVDKKSKDTLASYDLHVVAPEIVTKKLTLQQINTVSYNAANYIKCAVAKPVWISSKSSVVSIDKKTGEMKIKGKGNAIIFAVFNGKSIKDKNGSKKRFKIKVRVE